MECEVKYDIKNQGEGECEVNRFKVSSNTLSSLFNNLFLLHQLKIYSFPTENFHIVFSNKPTQIILNSNGDI